MKETILLYNLDSAAIRNKIKFLCIQGGIHIRVVEKNQYDVPIGTLAFGKKEDMELYLRSESSEEKPSFNDPMLVFAGFTGQKLDQFLNAMRKQKIPKINLKAMLTSSSITCTPISIPTRAWSRRSTASASTSRAAAPSASWASRAAARASPRCR